MLHNLSTFSYVINQFPANTVVIHIMCSLTGCNDDNLLVILIPPPSPSGECVNLFNICEDLQDVVSPDWRFSIRINLVRLFRVPESHILRDGCA